MFFYILSMVLYFFFFFFSSRRRHTRYIGDWSSDVCSSDLDGWQDIFIANDHMPNFLFHNNRNGTFREVGYLAGVAVSADGQFEAGMGTDAADTTGSGRLDLIVGHLDMQLARVYQNMGDQTFEDATLRSKLSYSTYHMSTFGARF